MTEVIINDKLTYLNENYPFVDIPNLTDTKRCIHCGSVIKVKDFKVYKNRDGDEFICCPNAPECNGTVIDWMDIE